MSAQKLICYWICHLIVDEDEAVHWIADDMHDLSGDVFEVEEYEIDEEKKPKELSIIGCSANHKSGLHFLSDVFYDHWREQINEATLYFFGAYDGNYGTIHVPREITLKNTIRVEDVYAFFYEEKCAPLFNSMDGALQRLGFKNWSTCLTALILEFIFVDAEFCFYDAEYDEKMQVALEYGQKHDKNVFKEEHAKLLTIANFCEGKNRAYGRKFGDPRLNFMYMW